jgi:hypothetical protein
MIVLTACASDEKSSVPTVAPTIVATTSAPAPTTGAPDTSAATVTPDEACTTLVALHEYNDAFNGAAVSGDLARLQRLDAERSPDALGLYDELAGARPDLAADIDRARQLTADLSAIIQDAQTFDEVTGRMLAVDDLDAANRSVIMIDDLAEECPPG